MIEIRGAPSAAPLRRDSNPGRIEFVGDGPVHTLQLHFDQRGHPALRRGRPGRRAAGRAPARLSGILVRLARVFRAAGEAGFSRCRAGPARLQPEQQAGKPGRLSARGRRGRRLRAGRRAGVRPAPCRRARLGRGGGVDDGEPRAEKALERRDAPGAPSGDLAQRHAHRSRPAAQEPLRADPAAAVAVRNDAEDRELRGAGASLQDLDPPRRLLAGRFSKPIARPGGSRAP